jgi:DNA gyrase/topoisomerase IV subunit A
MDIVQPDGYLWSITDNGLAKATLMSEYPTQGRYGQGVINMRLPKEASEVVAVVVGSEKTELFITITTGSTKKVRLDKTVLGSRSVKPRSLLSMTKNARVTGAVTMTARSSPTGRSNGATSIVQQLTLIPEPMAEREVTQSAKRKAARAKS